MHLGNSGMEKPIRGSGLSIGLSNFFSIPFHRAIGYIFVSIFLNQLQNFNMNALVVNIPQLQAEFQWSLVQINWLYAIYMVPLVSLSFMLIKIRAQFGLRRFIRWALSFFLIVCTLNLFTNDFYPLLVMRFLSGIAAAPIASLAFLYMMHPFKEDKARTIGLSLHLTNVIMAAPLARLISPILLQFGGYHHLYYFEIILALSVLVLIYLYPIEPIPHEKVISRLDIIAYLIIALGLGANAIVMVMGPLANWIETGWIGYLIIFSIIFFVIAVSMELHRHSPLIDVRWLFRKEMIELILTLLAFRVLLSEQSTVVANFFQMFGLYNHDLCGVYLCVVLGCLAGGFTCMLFFRPGSEYIIYFIALTMLLFGSLQASFSTVETQPRDFYFSQFLTAFGGAMFLPPAMAKGLSLATGKGPLYTLSFIAVFLITQNTGGLVSAAFVKTLHKILFEHRLLADLTAGFADSSTQLINPSQFANLYLKAEVVAYNQIFMIYTLFALIVLIFFVFKLLSYKKLKTTWV